MWERFPKLYDRRGQLAGTMSGGEQAALAVARALVNEPKLVLVDEPSAGLAPLVVDEVFATLREVAASGVTMVLVEQNVAAALKLVDTVHLLQTGRVVSSGPVGELDRADARVASRHRPPPGRRHHHGAQDPHRGEEEGRAGQEEGRACEEEGSADQEEGRAEEMKRAFVVMVVALLLAGVTAANAEPEHQRPQGPARVGFGQGFPALVDHEWGFALGGFGGIAPNAARKHAPVIFVHGNNVDHADWYVVRDDFRAAGWTDQELYGLSYNGLETNDGGGTRPEQEKWAEHIEMGSDGVNRLTNNEVNAPDLYDFINAVRTYTGSPNFTLVGHSLGVTVARRTLKLHPELRPYLVAFVGIAGGNHGTSFCPPGSEDQLVSCNEVAAGTPWLAALNGPGGNDETYGATKWLTVSDGTGTADPAFAGPMYAASPRLAAPRTARTRTRTTTTCASTRPSWPTTARSSKRPTLPRRWPPRLRPVVPRRRQSRHPRPVRSRRPAATSASYSSGSRCSAPCWRSPGCAAKSSPDPAVGTVDRWPALHPVDRALVVDGVATCRWSAIANG